MGRNSSGGSRRSSGGSTHSSSSSSSGGSSSSGRSSGGSSYSSSSGGSSSSGRSSGGSSYSSSSGGSSSSGRSSGGSSYSSSSGGSSSSGRSSGGSSYSSSSGGSSSSGRHSGGRSAYTGSSTDSSSFGTSSGGSSYGSSSSGRHSGSRSFRTSDSGMDNNTTYTFRQTNYVYNSAPVHNNRRDRDYPPPQRPDRYRSTGLSQETAGNDSKSIFRGCLTPFAAVFLIFVLLGGLGALMGGEKESEPATAVESVQSSQEQSEPASDTAADTQTAVTKEDAVSGQLDTSEYYTDRLGWISQSDTLISGMTDFLDKTGVHPYLYLTEDVNGSVEPSDEMMDAFANDLYDRLFTDEYHFLLVFQEYGDYYMTWYVCGSLAASILDEYDAGIILDTVDKYYSYDDMEDEEFFSTVFSESGEKIMARKMEN